ncbi:MULTISPECIES: antibiotic biosynthesis monooxygenase family protein [unclassified Frankia]|uniref:antibiotic biosynthesis monooxygenase family protein n=1 Tax=unclassified Frankia TaxID=2632575 RepID=UPI0027DB740C|nr:MULTISPECIES: antibiotic biosynthesis monooxygenase family protein [unclassified Frankia]
MTDPTAPLAVPEGFQAVPAAPVLAMVRFQVPDVAAAEFAVGADGSLAALASARGFRGGRLVRAVDDPEAWVLVTEWDGPGAWRRALGGFELRQLLTPLLGWALDAPGAFEILVDRDGPGDAVRRHESALAPDAATATPGH